MPQQSEIFEKHYNDYCAQIAKIDLDSVKERLGMRNEGEKMLLSFFNRDYSVSGNGIFDASGSRPSYGVCVIIAKYILLCPDRAYHDPEWVSFKDFKRTSHFTNVNFFRSDTEGAIEKNFSGKLDILSKAGKELGGIHQDMEMTYDLSMKFDALPRISLLLLFNDGDEEFPAQCTVLFQKHSEFYLDPESLAMTGAALAKSLERFALKD
ncbi:conserved hypothetical protein [delta proteobacterium NaphS2]|nr:conserved hypothetical protein [delta proteobacterium NaphS2]